MVMAGIRADEWRLQRIRPFDWYSVEFKRQSQRELQAKYWKAWSIQVRCHRKARRHEDAATLLAQMDDRARATHGSEYWDAMALMVQLYIEGNQPEQATQRIEQMRHMLAEHPDPDRAEKLDRLQRQFFR